ncbi:hypothetical protein CVS40_11134 [Lucilia cuprina]|nr:hypothetical protein CVS40_11134 [Lucilia cuprina]
MGSNERTRSPRADDNGNESVSPKKFRVDSEIDIVRHLYIIEYLYLTTLVWGGHYAFVVIFVTPKNIGVYQSAQNRLLSRFSYG